MFPGAVLPPGLASAYRGPTTVRLATAPRARSRARVPALLAAVLRRIACANSDLRDRLSEYARSIPQLALSAHPAAMPPTQNRYFPPRCDVERSRNFETAC